MTCTGSWRVFLILTAIIVIFVVLRLASLRVHRTYLARVRAGQKPGRILTFLEVMRAYSANEEPP